MLQWLEPRDQAVKASNKQRKEKRKKKKKN